MSTTTHSQGNFAENPILRESIAHNDTIFALGIALTSFPHSDAETSKKTYPSTNLQPTDDPDMLVAAFHIPFHVCEEWMEHFL